MVFNSHTKGQQGSRGARTWAPEWHSWRAGCQLCWFSGTSRAASPRWSGRTPLPSPPSWAPAPQAVWACRSTALHTCVVQQTELISILSSHKGFSRHRSLRFQTATRRNGAMEYRSCRHLGWLFEGLLQKMIVGHEDVFVMDVFKDIWWFKIKTVVIIQGLIQRKDCSSQECFTIVLSKSRHSGASKQNYNLLLVGLLGSTAASLDETLVIYFPQWLAVLFPMLFFEAVWASWKHILASQCDALAPLSLLTRWWRAAGWRRSWPPQKSWPPGGWPAPWWGWVGSCCSSSSRPEERAAVSESTWFPSWNNKGGKAEMMVSQWNLSWIKVTSRFEGEIKEGRGWVSVILCAWECELVHSEVLCGIPLIVNTSDSETEILWWSAWGKGLV